MANPWMTVFQFRGWSADVTIHAEFTDGQNGPPFTGSIPLYMRKGNDAATDTVMAANPDGSGHFTADVIDGKWDLGNTDLTGWANDGFNTLVFDCNGRRIPRTLQRQHQPAPGNAAGGTGPRGTNPAGTFRFTKFDKRPPRKIEDASGKLTGYNVPVFGTVVQGKQSARQTDLVMFRDGKEETGVTVRTDDSGNFSYIFRNIPPGGHENDNYVRLEAGVKNSDARSNSLDVEVPVVVEKKNIPKASKVSASVKTKNTSDANKVSYAIRQLVIDQDRKGMENVEVEWTTEDGQTGTVTTDKNGWAEHSVEITEAGGKVKYTAIVIEFSLEMEKPLLLDGPKAKEQAQAATLKTVVKESKQIDDRTMRHTIRVLAQDAKGNPVGNVTAAWTLNGQPGGTVTTSGNTGNLGWVDHDVDISKKSTYQAADIMHGISATALELAAPSPKKTANRILCDINTQRDPDGFYRMVITTLCGDDPMQGRFELCSGATFSLKNENGTPIGSGSSFSNLETAPNGVSAYLIKPELPAEQTQMLLTSKLPAGGASCTQPVANITLKRQRRP